VKVRLKRVVTLVTSCDASENRPFVALDTVESGTGRLLTNEIPERSCSDAGVASVEIGDVLFGKLRPYLAKSWLADRPVFASTELLCLRAEASLEPAWLAYLCLSRPFVEWATATSDGTKMPRTGWDKLGEIWVDLPDKGMQRETVDYLDAETARIDSLVAKKRRMIQLLEEQAASWTVGLIVGDGLRGRPSVSGLYSAVPMEWTETCLRHLGCDVQTGPFGSQLHAGDYVEGGWPVVNPMNIVGGEITRVEDMTISVEKRTELARHILRPGDIVFARRGEMGRAGLVTSDQDGWLCGTGSLRLRIRGKSLSPQYLKLLLETRVARSYFEIESVGSTMDNLNSEIVLAFPTLVPPLPEQDRIVNDVACRRSRAAAPSRRLARQIDLLTEHRQALITAAVTGELDIPGLAA
jgi:type I restriction enzyme S subunit